jgi:putative Mg2+ transporter-C (MgtC) family protein
VAVAACGFMLVGLREFPDAEPRARVLYGIITGIGFIGGGAILKGKGSVSGTATAASLWTTGAIGVAVANNRYEIAVALTAFNIITLIVGYRFKKEINGGSPPSDETDGD